jgi:hypothetical protein
MTQPTLFDVVPSSRPRSADAEVVTATERCPRFDGETFDRERDGERLATLLGRVKAEMGDGQWKTLRHLAVKCKGSEASVSARIRDLRKPKFGGFNIEHRCVGSGVWEYRMSLIWTGVPKP